MDKIIILPPDISSKIAAGEVVENPASVVKELAENAIDADASFITVEIKNGGITYIRITDNGCGMEREDAKNSFLRHATSKISSFDDLFNINTLGFRGEALAGIAAVSNVELITKTENGEGVFLQLEAGKLKSEQPAGCPKGTTIAVMDLFFNTPARMKFLKRDKTETSYVTNVIQRLALGNPGIGIKYIVNEKEHLFTAGDGNLKSCIYGIYGREYANGGIEIDAEGKNIRISGIIGNPQTSRGNRSFQSFFLNGRYIKNKALTFAAEAAYKNLLMTGKFPFYAIHINTPPSFADVNVHPSKQEVKFADERAVCDAVYWALKNALTKEANEQIKVFKPKSTHSFKNDRLSEPIHQIEIPDIGSVKGFISHIAQSGGNQIDKTQTEYKIAGQLFNTYIIAEFNDRIILIDQHAAHERIIFERLKKAYALKNPLSQALLSPIVLVLSPDEHTNLLDNLEDFINMGFKIEDFGNNSILVRQTPVNLEQSELKALISELLLIKSLPGGAISKYDEKMLQSISCKAAVKGNHSLQRSEIDALIAGVLSEDGISTCPHGRPLTVTITKYEFEKMFKRIV